MAPDLDRAVVLAQRLPESGMCIIPPWLVIAIDGMPTVSIDLRRVDHVGRMAEYISATEPVDHPIAPGERDRRADLVLVCGSLEFPFHVSEGPEAAASAAAQAAAVSRSEPRPPIRKVVASAHYGTLVATSGANAGAEVALDALATSIEHVVVTRDEVTGRYTIAGERDLFVDGNAVASSMLRHAATIGIGELRLRFVDAGCSLAYTLDTDLDPVIFLDDTPVLVTGCGLSLRGRTLRFDDILRALREEVPTGRELIPAALLPLAIATHERDTAPPLPADAERRYVGTFRSAFEVAITIEGGRLWMQTQLDDRPSSLDYRGSDTFSAALPPARIDFTIGLEGTATRVAIRSRERDRDHIMTATRIDLIAPPQLPAHAASRYPGRYLPDDGAPFVIALVDGWLQLERAGSAMRLEPRGDDVWAFLGISAIELQFAIGSDGVAKSCELRMPGEESLVAMRIGA